MIFVNVVRAAFKTIGDNADLLLLVVTSISVVCAFSAYLHQNKRARKEAACDLAKYYAHEILDYCQFVIIVLNISGKSSQTKGLFPMEALKEFNYSEMSHILHQKEINVDEFLKEMISIDPAYILGVRYSTAENIEERHNIQEEYLISDGKDENDIKLRLKNSKMLQAEFYRGVSKLLNDLEWFAMTCRYGLAEEDLLYQSLHQTYLAYVWTLYPYICKNNHNNEDKYYTNLIWLFNQWSSRLRKIKTKVQKKKSKKERQIQKKQAELEQAQKKSENVQAPIHKGKSL